MTEIRDRESAIFKILSSLVMRCLSSSNLAFVSSALDPARWACGSRLSAARILSCAAHGNTG